MAGPGQQLLANELGDALHHHLRFRAVIEFQAQGEFEVKTGATGKSKLVEVVEP